VDALARRNKGVTPEARNTERRAMGVAFAVTARITAEAREAAATARVDVAESATCIGSVMTMKRGNTAAAAAAAAAAARSRRER
jgi:hypothetical protein